MFWRSTFPRAIAFLAGVALVGTLFAPWMGVHLRNEGDVQGGASTFIWWGTRLPFNAFHASDGVAIVLTIIGVLTSALALLKILRPRALSERSTGLLFLGLALTATLCIVLISFVIDSNPFSAAADGGIALVAWVPLVGPKLATLCAALIAVSGAGTMLFGRGDNARNRAVAELQVGARTAS